MLQYSVGNAIKGFTCTLTRRIARGIIVLNPYSSTIVKWAAKQAETLLAPLENCWIYVQCVVAQAHWIGLLLFDETNKEILIAAVWSDLEYYKRK